MLTVETLNGAMHKELTSVEIAVGILDGSQILAPEEQEYSAHILKRLEAIREARRHLFKASEISDKIFAIGARARTMQDEVAALREAAFWTSDVSGMMAIEESIKEQVSIYEGVRDLLRLVMAKDLSISRQEPANVPALPSNRYMRMVLPEAFL